jgi:hypothetical protein
VGTELGLLLSVVRLAIFRAEPPLLPRVLPLANAATGKVHAGPALPGQDHKPRGQLQRAGNVYSCGGLCMRGT